jgi:hypothetical protein
VANQHDQWFVEGVGRPYDRMHERRADACALESRFHADRSEPEDGTFVRQQMRPGAADVADDHIVSDGDQGQLRDPGVGPAQVVGEFRLDRLGVRVGGSESPRMNVVDGVGVGR